MKFIGPDSVDTERESFKVNVPRKAETIPVGEIQAGPGIDIENCMNGPIRTSSSCASSVEDRPQYERTIAVDVEVSPETIIDDSSKM